VSGVIEVIVSESGNKFAVLARTISGKDLIYCCRGVLLTCADLFDVVYEGIG